jgi:hypothetical protein
METSRFNSTRFDSGLEVAQTTLTPPIPNANDGDPPFSTEQPYQALGPDLLLEQKPRTICGLRRTTFWLLMVIIILILAGAIGGGVGGSAAAKRNVATGTSNG